MSEIERAVSANSSTPVLVVGAGPVGTVLALELARHGVGAVLVEQSTTPSPYPKMDYINGRTMELVRRLGVADRIRERGVGPEHSFNFIWSRDFDEPPIAVWEYASVEQMQQTIAAVNDGSVPTEAYQRLQGSLLEETLRDFARENPRIDMREGWKFLGLQEGPNGVTASVVDATTNTRHTIQARYVVACDGARSAVRTAAEIPVHLAGPPTQHVDVYFRSTDPTLRRWGRAFLTIAAGGLTLVSRDEKDTWTGTFMLGVGDEQTFTGDPVRMMYEKLGVEFAVDEVLNVAQWQGMLAVADTYRRGSVFLAGDSAHSFYPTGGHGANTGIADAVDLGWKLAAVVNGWAGPALLDSYDAERRPVALFNREMCANLLEVWKRFAVLVGQGTPREVLAGFLEHETYQMDNVGIHFGYRYSSPVVCAEAGQPPRWDWNRITPTTWPGMRAPSLRLGNGTPLFDQLGAEFTLVDFTPDQLGERLVKEANSRGVPVTHLPVDDDNARTAWERDLVLVRPDHHVAWRGDDVPDDWDAVLDTARGF